jgi:hypothetical protein
MRFQRSTVAVAASIISLAGGGEVAYACAGESGDPGTWTGATTTAAGTTTTGTTTTGTTTTATTTDPTTTSATTNSVRRSPCPRSPPNVLAQARRRSRKAIQPLASRGQGRDSSAGRAHD